MKTKAEGVQRIWNRYKYAGLVILIGAALLLWPAARQGTAASPDSSGMEKLTEEGDLARRLEEVLGNVSGVGQVRVLLTLESDGERFLAQDTELSYSGDTASPEDYSRRSATVVMDGGGRDETVTVRQTYPAYRGALVVCQGGDRAEVRLAVTQAVAAVTGLSTDRVAVAKWQ